MNGEDEEEEEEEEKEEEEKEKEKNILTSHVNCLEETSHHAVPHCMNGQGKVRGIYSCMISYCLPVGLEENLLFPS